MHEQLGKERCVAYSDKGVSVTESLESAIPSDEGSVTIVDPRKPGAPEFAREGYPQVERSRDADRRKARNQ